MKRINIAMAAMAAALSFTFASCADLDTDTPAKDATETEVELVEGGDMPVTFNCYMSDDDATRTEFHDNTIWWSEGDAIKFYQRYIATPGDAYSVGSLSKAVTESSKQYSTTLNFNSPVEFPAYYFALYPISSIVTYRTKVSGETGYYSSITVPSEQNPSLVSYDRTADVLISEYIEADKKQTSFNLHFRRPVALGKMTIKNLPSESDIKSVRIENNKYYFAGNGLFGLDNDNFLGVSSGSGNTSLTLNYNESVTANSAEGMTAYFTCLPFTFAENDSFIVTVTTVAGEIFTKKVTVPAGREIKFEADKGTRFNVDMSTAEKTCEWLSLNPYSSGSYVPTIDKTYAGLAGSDIASVKWCTADMTTFGGIADFDTYIESNGIDLSSTGITNLNSGKKSVLSKTGTIDTEYAFIVKATNNSGQSVILTTTARTDWFKLALVSRSKGGVQLQLSGVGLNPSKCKNYRVVATDDLPTTASEIEAYYKNTLSPGTNAALMESINAKNGESYNIGITTYYENIDNTSVSMVAGINYTAMMLVYNTRGESKFVYASANAK